MIYQQGPVRVVMNDRDDNEVGDYALIRIDIDSDNAGSKFEPVTPGWRLIGVNVAGYERCRFVDYVMIFEGYNGN